MCVRMQRETWGEAFVDIVPSGILKVSQRIGGVTAGAFDSAGRLMGFVFGMTGTQSGELVHWSDMLAVHPNARNRGLGARLKLYQRELLLPLGVRTMFWTYDPLMAKNAHINIVKLGAKVVEYVVNMYGAETRSELRGSLGSDRFIVAWDLATDHGRAGASRVAHGTDTDAQSPIVNPVALGDKFHVMPAAALPDVPVVRVEIPGNVAQMIEGDPDAAAGWRAATRRAFTHYLERGYRVTDFSRGPTGDRYHYTLTRYAI
jgi:chorismate synthase